MAYAKREYYYGNENLYYAMKRYGMDNPYTSLFPNIGINDPEDSYSGIPYEKGAQFMYYIESLIGEELMQTMMQQYIQSFSGLAITHEQFQVFYENFVYMNFIGIGDGTVVANITSTSEYIINQTMWDQWIYQPGQPPVRLDFSNSLIPPLGSSAAQTHELTSIFTSPSSIIWQTMFLTLITAFAAL